MSWYNYFFCFLAGMFLANVVPHFVHGISGDPFPTPFAHPPGKGLSSATTNVVWALDNHYTGLLSLMIDPLVEDLRHDCRYNSVLAKIGLPVRL